MRRGSSLNFSSLTLYLSRSCVLQLVCILVDCLVCHLLLSLFISSIAYHFVYIVDICFFRSDEHNKNLSSAQPLGSWFLNFDASMHVIRPSDLHLPLWSSHVLQLFHNAPLPCAVDHLFAFLLFRRILSPILKWYISHFGCLIRSSHFVLYSLSRYVIFVLFSGIFCSTENVHILVSFLDFFS